MERLYTTDEVMERYRVDRSTVYGWLRRGALPRGRKVGKRRYFTAGELAELERAGEARNG